MNADALNETLPAEIDDVVVNFERLAEWMDSQGLGSGPITHRSLLTGGTQNILIRFRRSGRDYVMRRPPRHPRPGNNETMIREARMLGALADSDVPHPRLIKGCSSADVLGAAFYLMEPIDGFNASVGLPALHAGSREIRRQMGFGLVDGATALGRVDYLAAGLSDFGKIDNYLGRQVARWRAQLDSYATLAGWPGPGEIPGIDKVANWLEANRPQTFEPGIIHGDYHFANVMYRHDGPKLAAIVDWELTTIGDPLIDLGWILATWPDPEGEGTIPVIEPWDGFPEPKELIACYGDGSSRDLSAVEWYAVLACYKLGIILEGTHARACAGMAPKETGDQLHASTLNLFRRALKWIA